MRKMLNNGGWNLTELMVGVALAGFVGLVTTKAFQDQSSNEAYLKFTAAVNRATMEVQAAMSNNERCNQMLAGKTRDSNLWPNNTTSFSPLAMTDKILLQADTEYAEGFYIPPNGLQLAEGRLGGVNNANVTELIITFKTRNRALWKNGPTIKGSAEQGTIVKRIPFLTTMVTPWNGTPAPGNHVIKACGPVVQDADIAAKKTMCDALGSETATWDGTTCKLTNNFTCPDGQIPTRVESLGRFTCVAAAQGANMNEIFDFSASTCTAGQSVTLQPDPSTGKIRAVCVGGGGTNCPSGMILTWNVGDNVCTANTATPLGTFDSTTFNASDTVGPTTSQSPVQFTCNGYRKTWVLTGTPSCVTTSNNCVAGQIVRWSGASKFCQATAGAMTNGQTTTLTRDIANSSPGASGTAVVECRDGKVAVIGVPTAPSCI